MHFGQLGAGICVQIWDKHESCAIQLWTLLRVHVLVQNLRFCLSV